MAADDLQPLQDATRPPAHDGQRPARVGHVSPSGCHLGERKRRPTQPLRLGSCKQHRPTLHKPRRQLGEYEHVQRQAG
eukprot:3690196-Alexandrium_andersonii.AAC.1